MGERTFWQRLFHRTPQIKEPGLTDEGKNAMATRAVLESATLILGKESTTLKALNNLITDGKIKIVVGTLEEAANPQPDDGGENYGTVRLYHQTKSDGLPIIFISCYSWELVSSIEKMGEAEKRAFAVSCASVARDAINLRNELLTQRPSTDEVFFIAPKS